ncbi:hypothetical protein BX600DRAFT_510678 [Xylariales sp. PMI_506]|nr:hypothetical protein BX600DRAFT_510678 [Xylariales sp. PMI_506]
MEPSYEDLFSRAKTLQTELELFAEHLRSTSRGSIPILQVAGKLSSLRSDVQNEVDFLQRTRARAEAAASSEGREAKGAEQNGRSSGSGSGGREGGSGLHSTNLPYFETLWDTAKRSSGLFDVRLKVCVVPTAKPALAPGRRIVPSVGTQHRSRLRHVPVDLVVDDGLTWVKISTMTNRRLLMDLAKENVFCGDSDEEGEEGYGDGNGDEDGDVPAGGGGMSSLLSREDLDVPLLKIARELKQASENYRIRTRKPAIRIVLPRIREGEIREIDLVLELCRQTGAEVICGGPDLPLPPPPLTDELMRRMRADPVDSFSDVLNLDTSVLVALTSEFAHAEVDRQDWFDRQRLAHCVQEKREKFLPTHLYPLIAGRPLVCVREAADVYRHIVETIGTEMEKARARLLLGDEGRQEKEEEEEEEEEEEGGGSKGGGCGGPARSSPERLVEEFAALSIHSVPATLQLPVRVVDSNEGGCQDRRLPAAARGVLQSQLRPGRSVFAYGWAAGCTTITCNNVATKQLAQGLEESGISGGDDDGALPIDEADWPSIWACAASRPLLGVPEGTWARKHIGDCETNGCSCGLEQLRMKYRPAAPDTDNTLRPQGPIVQ